MHLNFDNSEDGFFPDDPSVDLLNEVESEYRANLDFIRVLDEIQTGDLLETDTWRSLAIIEATMLNNSDFAPYHYPLFGTQANNGPAGQAMQWMALHDEVSAEAWLPSLQSATAEVLMANDEANLSAALSNLSQAASDVPEVQPVTTDRLLSWDPQDPAVWLPRMDTGKPLGRIGGGDGSTCQHDAEQNSRPARSNFSRFRAPPRTVGAFGWLAVRRFQSSDSVLYPQRGCR